MKIFDKTELKLAILHCLEKNETKNLWKEIKKVTENPSFFEFIYLIYQIKKTKLYPKINLQIKFKKSSKFYNMLCKYLINNDYIIENGKLPITNEKLSYVIKRWKISKKLIKQLTEKNKIEEIVQCNQIILQKEYYVVIYIFSLLFMIHLPFFLTLLFSFGHHYI